MTSLTDLREVVDVVIGVDTHVHTHSAAVVDAATGGVLDEITVEATAEGYAELVEFVRVGVQLLYEHLQPLREPAPTGPRETLH